MAALQTVRWSSYKFPSLMDTCTYACEIFFFWFRGLWFIEISDAELNFLRFPERIEKPRVKSGWLRMLMRESQCTPRWEKLCIWQSHHVAFYIVHALPVQEYTLNLNSRAHGDVWHWNFNRVSALHENNRCRPLIISKLICAALKW